MSVKYPINYQANIQSFGTQQQFSQPPTQQQFAPPPQQQFDQQQFAPPPQQQFGPQQFGPQQFGPQQFGPQQFGQPPQQQFVQPPQQQLGKIPLQSGPQKQQSIKQPKQQIESSDDIGYSNSESKNFKLNPNSISSQPLRNSFNKLAEDTISDSSSSSSYQDDVLISSLESNNDMQPRINLPEMSPSYIPGHINTIGLI